ncbi:MAG: hypothetical protein JXA79_08215, partial [Deltaproteobacteria bacterium]|nr:hypothetical protein [Deltaproteobacteria bacterium]
SSVKVGFLRIKPFTYKYLLGTINMHILTRRPLGGNKEADRTIVYDSLIKGSCFVAHDGLYPAKGFRFFFQTDKGKKIIEMGNEGICSPGIIVIRSPAYCLMKIIQDGNVLSQSYGNKLSKRIYEKGVYRAELYRKTPYFGWRPWIFSNPVYLK